MVEVDKQPGKDDKSKTESRRMELLIGLGFVAIFFAIMQFKSMQQDTGAAVGEKFGPAPAGKPQRKISNQDYLRNWATKFPPSENALAVGKDAKEKKAIDLKINPPAELDGFTLKSFEKLRSQETAEYPNLLAKPYTLYKPIYADIKEGGAWWGITGFFKYGSGVHSMDGPSLLGKTFANPFLLVEPEWELVFSNDPINDANEVVDLPFMPPLEKLTFDAAKSKLKAVYGFSKLKANDPPYQMHFGTINAREFGYNFLAVSEIHPGYEEIEKVDKQGVNIWSTFEYVHQTTILGVQSGNCAAPMITSFNMTPPCKLKVKLWKDYPDTVHKTADFTCEFDFK